MVQDALLRTLAQLSFSFDGNEIKYDRLVGPGFDIGLWDIVTPSCDIE